MLTLPPCNRDISTIVVDHYNIQPTYDIYADVDRRDLGAVANQSQQLMKAARKKLPGGTFLELRGEVHDHG